MAIASIVLTVISWSVSYLSKNAHITDFYFGSKIGEALAHSSWLALIAYLILRFVLKKRGYGLALFAILLLAVSGIKIGEIRRDGKAFADVARAVTAIHTAAQSGHELSESEYDALTKGEIRPIADFLRDYYRESTRLVQDYSARIDSTGLKQMLLPANLSSPEKLAWARSALPKVDSIIGHYGELVVKTVTGAPEKLTALSSSRYLSKDFLKGFASGATRSGKSLEDYFEKEHRFVSKLDELFALMQEAEGKYHFEETRPVFEETAHVERYNELMIALSTIAKQEQEIFETARSRAKSDFDSSKQL